MSQGNDIQGSERLRGLLLRLSSLAEQAMSWGADAPAEVAALAAGLDGEAQGRGSIMVQVLENGALSCEDLVVEPSAAGLGSLLFAAGVRSLQLRPGLNALAITRFLQTVFVIGSEPAGGDGDLVTVWFETGDASISFAHTSLDVTHLNSDLAALPTEVELMAAFGSPSSRPSSTTLEFLASAASSHMQPLQELPRFAATDRDALREALQQCASEGEDSLRRQLSLEILAFMGAHFPSLSPRELSILVCKTAGEQIDDGAWDDVLRFLRNLEMLLDEQAKVSDFTREVASQTLTQLASSRMMQRVLSAIEDGDVSPPPFKFVRFFVGEEPQERWRELAGKATAQQLQGLVAFFSVCYAFQHPFWEEALKPLTPEGRHAVSNLIASLETQWSDDDRAPRSPTGTGNMPMAETPPPIEDIRWEDFDFEELDAGPEVDLDDSLLAFLDEGNSHLGDRNEQSDIPPSMLEQLEELERSIAGQADQESAGSNG